MMIEASDEQSGIHKLGFKLFVGNKTKPIRTGFVTGNRNDVRRLLYHISKKGELRN